MLAVDHQFAVYRRCGLAISYRLPRRAQAPTGRADALYTTWAILYEFLRVTTHARVRSTCNVRNASSILEYPN